MQTKLKAPAPTGDWTAQNAKGRESAAAAMEGFRGGASQPAFIRLVRGVATGPESEGFKVGFFSALAGSL